MFKNTFWVPQKPTSNPNQNEQPTSLPDRPTIKVDPQDIPSWLQEEVVNSEIKRDKLEALLKKYELIFNSPKDAAEGLIKECINDLEQLEDWNPAKKYLSICYNETTDIFFRKNQFDQAYQWALKAFNINPDMDNRKDVIFIAGKYATQLCKEKQYQEYLAVGKLIINLTNEVINQNDFKEFGLQSLAYEYHRLGGYYLYQLNYSEAKKCYLTSADYVAKFNMLEPNQAQKHPFKFNNLIMVGRCNEMIEQIQEYESINSNNNFG